MKIAIRGHESRGKEVIQILESLGGINTQNYSGSNPECYYEIHNSILCMYTKSDNIKYYTLEEFETQFPFKIGDKVITNDSRIGVVEKLIPGDTYPYRVKINNINYWSTPTSLRLYKEMKEERNITLTLEKAKEWYKKGGELKEVALQAYSEKELTEVELPKTWEEFCRNYPVKVEECWMGSQDTIYSATMTQKRIYGNWIPSKKSAEAHLALIQLEQLRNCWRQGWEPMWDCSEKWCIRLLGNELNVGITTNISRFLTFPTKEMAEKFLKCFRDLIEKAGNLI